MKLHPYASDAAERSYIRACLALISLVIAWLLNLLFSFVDVPGWFWSPPSMMGAYGLACLWFNRWGWRLAWLRRLGIVRIPDLDGTWVGKLTSSHDGHTKQTPVEVRIQQRWTRILITLDAEESRSRSVTASILAGASHGVRLSYEYTNDPKPGAADTMHHHTGHTALTLADASSMEGEYYSGRDRQNFGSIQLTRDTAA